MKIGDIINLEANEGAQFALRADLSVCINYKSSVKAVFHSDDGNVRFGILSKIGTNSYIISGQ